ncbi:hypothetical protein DP149_10150 [Clostridium tetani]|nr:hypothetical protein [Clostridium tetani]KGI37933.1 hypothetical protein KY52_10390 [Clostridium tetani]KGI45344.1 hypothetical protein KY54_04370 [Clostridium tetani]KHO31964.1 hypothetical protein OR63_08000 [Clostridium tetani]KIG22147.1 hypothetical protein RS78_00575 [Clostridium tetani]RXI62089.1 hypothetical protein DP125_04720 [Clostridium tetani]
MNIKNLKTGMVLKNYKELCETLEEKVKSGKSKRLQLKDWERYFEWEKEGYKFIITEIYDKPKKKIDGRKVGNTGKNPNSYGNAKAEYIGNIQKLVLDLLAQDTNDLSYGRVFLSKNQLLRALKMINDNYAFCKQRIHKLSKFIKIDKETVEEWYDSTSSMLERNLEVALKELEKQSLIFWSREITVAEAQSVAEMENLGEIIKTTKTDVYGEEILNYEYYADNTVILKHREATDKEKRFILRTEREVLKEMQCKNKAEVILKGVWSNFIEKVNNTILKELNIAFYYKSYKILFNGEHISEAIDDFEIFELDYYARIEEQQQLNKCVDDKIYTNAKRRHQKAKNENILGKIHKDAKINRRAAEDYIKNNKELNKNLIDAKARDIKDLVKKTKTGELSREDIKVIESL